MRRARPRSLLLLLLPLLTGCATVVNGSRDAVELVAPPDVAITDEQGEPIEVVHRRDSTRHLQLSRRGTQRVVLALDTTRVVYEPTPSFDPGWLFIDLVAGGGPVGILIDAGSRSWSDFGDAAIILTRDSTGERA